MKRTELEHVIRAAGSIANSNHLVIIGSQAILASFPNAPDALTVSQEADTVPIEAPEKADLIDGSIGEGSPFHDTFGYYAHGVSIDTAVLPAKWQSRLVAIENENTNGVVGLCLSPADLAVSKLAAGREKDLGYVAAMLSFRLLSSEAMENAISELNEPHRSTVHARFGRLLADRDR